jgi:large subunit ribosomal protein L5
MISTISFEEYKKFINDVRNPRLEKIVVNIGIGKYVTSSPQLKERVLSDVEKILALITGQKPSPRRARKSISGFKLKAGEIVGYKVTLRGKRMFDFFTRIVNIALPRSRDFKGIPLSSVDKHGNLTIGFPEHIVFPEASAENVGHLYGLEVTFVPRARNREEAIYLYNKLGVPFKK